MAQVQVQKLSNRHEAIARFLIENPEMKLGLVAEHFKVSQPWLSVLIHSHCFQMRLTEMNEDVFHEVVIPLREKVEALGHKTVEMMLEKLDMPVGDIPFDTIADATEMSLKMAGYGAKPAPQVIAPPGGQFNQQNNYYGNLTPEELANARNKIGTSNGAIPHEQSGGELPSPEELQASVERLLGSPLENTATVHSAEEEKGSSEAGD